MRNATLRAFRARPRGAPRDAMSCSGPAWSTSVFSCSKPAVLCVSRRPPVVSGPEAKVEVLRARVLGWDHAVIGSFCWGVT